MSQGRPYQPAITRLPCLFCLLVFTLALIALVEIAARRLPSVESKGIFKIVYKDGMRRRDVESAPQDGSIIPSSPTTLPPYTASAAASAYLPLTTSPLVISTTEGADFTYYSAAASAYLPLVTTALDAGQVSDTTFGAASAAHTDYLPLKGTQVLGTVTVSPSKLDGIFGNSPNAKPTKIGSIDNMPYTLKSGILHLDSTTFDVATPTTARLHNGRLLNIDTTGAISVEIPLTNTSAMRQGDAIYQARVLGVTPQQYVIGAFVPTILAVLFTIPWRLLALAFQEMEPFYQLQQPEGIPASKSLLLNYKNSITVIATISAIRKGHFLVWWSGLTSLIVLILAPLASETVFIGFVGGGVCTATSGRGACTPRLSVFPAAARLIQGILSFVAVLTVALAIALVRKRSGVYSNPLSIASVAALFQDPDLIEEFRRLNPHATDKKSLQAALQSHRFRLGFYKDVHDRSSYGITLCHDVSNSDEKPSLKRDGKKYASLGVEIDGEELPVRRKQKMTSAKIFTHPATIAIFGLFVAGMEILVVYYYQTGGDTPFERFMDSQSFGVTFLFTAVAVAIKLYWTLLDDEFQATEPYRRLLHGPVPPSDSILLAPHSNPFTGLFYSLHNRHFFNVYTSSIVILCEPLIVALSNIPFKPGLAFMAYKVCTYISIGILSLMLIGIIWMLCRMRFRMEVVDRPDTLAALMVALCGSRMLEDFAGMSILEREERDSIVKGWGKEYAMGDVVGVDGVERMGIDEGVFIEMERGKGTSAPGVDHQ